MLYIDHMILKIVKQMCFYSTLKSIEFIQFGNMVWQLIP